ncbi:MAG: hypothetical protein A2X13_02210 [Bacteroidetes bacterium GWC2_33_15]|nr:MAG: hypothetical protein A2X10_07415 [Bacteroidetes bacterium GWA2_33_15]OFX52289.1 MAG: hypothetical protein A2X13_02210 [Bacteroidetes bacterium GWC2_33_15]OFX64443.1 MAG: hypothetical protein A2X15_13030 [Bacteroidetes bacterium GWB2_32_14]OFX67848.1 MAG: hypothetical protein A2X14_06855 [Bacteroidetes bacterium GWD2_33_33]HAN19466.1 hypothetical protein [Bacteroidales bacterium]
MNNQKTKIIESYLNDRASIVIIYLDKDGKIITFNTYIEQIAGKKQLNGQFHQLVVDFNGKFNINDIKSGSGQLLSINTLTGIPITLQFSFFETRDGYIAIGEHNVIELEKMNVSFVQLSNELNNLSRELIKKNTELKKLNDLKNEFLGIAAHDIRNPASLISGYCSLLANSNMNQDKQKQFLEIIKSSGDSILKLINDLLDVSVIESGNLRLERANTDVFQLIKKNIDRNRFFADQKSIQINLFKPEELLILNIDSAKIDQVLDNYISNAIKYSKNNTTIKVIVKKHNDEIIVSVSDEGVGIKKYDLSKLFQFFSKTDSETTAGESSTGLGLAIVKKIINEHNGRVWAESVLGKGSVFYFSLPIKQEYN